MSGSGQYRVMLLVIGAVVAIAAMAGLVLLGYALGSRQSATEEATSTAPAVGAVSPTPTFPVVFATYTPLPQVTPTWTPVPPTPTQAVPMIVAGDLGLNVRAGPGLNFRTLIHVNPGTQFVVIGRYADWWQIDYNGTPAWAYSGVVTAFNTEGVPEVVPPPSPVPPTPTATLIPPTPTPAATPTPDTRGIVGVRFDVERAPGPFGNAGDVWFNMEIRNTSNVPIVVAKWGAWIQENGVFQMSWGGPTAGEPLSLAPGQSFQWRDHLYAEQVPGTGTYHLWMRLCFQDGYCVNLKGPVEFRIG